MVSIEPRWRVGLAAKATLLWAIGAAFSVGGWLSLQRVGVAWIWVPIAVVAGGFTLWAGALGWFDALVGEAVVEEGPIRTIQRRSGLSARLPSGRTAEYLLFRVGPPLVDGARYRIVIGRRSGVMVAWPVRLTDARPSSPARVMSSPTAWT